MQPTPILRSDRAPHTTASWQLWAENNLVDTWNEACGEVINYKGFDFSTARDLPQTVFEFPDGYNSSFGEERYRFNEMLFDPKNYFNQVSFRSDGRRKLTVRTSLHQHLSGPSKLVRPPIPSKTSCRSLSSFTIPSWRATSMFGRLFCRTSSLSVTRP